MPPDVTVHAVVGLVEVWILNAIQDFTASLAGVVVKAHGRRRDTHRIVVRTPVLVTVMAGIAVHDLPSPLIGIVPPCRDVFKAAADISDEAGGCVAPDTKGNRAVGIGVNSRESV